MVNYKDKKIIYTLKYAGYATKKQINLFVIIGSLLSLLSLTVFILLMVDGDIVTAVISIVVLFPMGLGCLLVPLLAYIQEKKHDKEISKWLTDEKLFETVTKPWEFSSIGGFRTNYKFGIDFEMNGKSFRKMSLHYDGFYRLIRDKEIKILFSPKYDEVMILED